MIGWLVIKAKHLLLPKMSDECPRYIFRQDTQLCGG